MEKPDLQIIDRERAIKEVREHFSDQINLLEDVTNYGSQIITRILDEEQKGLDYFVVISILFKHILTMLDSIATQVSHGNIISAHLQARSNLEVALYIEWILKEDTLKRSKYYYVSYYRKEKERILNYIKNKLKNTKLAQKIESYRNKIEDIPKDIDKAFLDELNRIDAILNRPDLVDIRKDFENIEAKRKNKQIVDWYVPTGINNLRKLADELKLTEKHYLFYNNYSKLMHGVAINEHVSFNNGKIYLKPLRELIGIDTLITTVLADIFRCYKLVIQKYLPGETKNFAEKYIKKWQKSFMNIKSVTYQ